MRWSDLRRRHQGYSGARPDVVAMLPAITTRVLDVGCGAGLTALLIRERHPEARITGVESSPDLALMARACVDRMIQGSIEDELVLQDVANEGAYDVIICADVLEHVANPLPVLRALVGMLTDDGVLITSLPNVRHISTFISLGLFGTWPARERGIHDQTHLRFFARPDILRLGTSAGLKCIKERRNMRLVESLPWTSPPAKALDFWPLRSFFTFQYLHGWKRIAKV